MQERTKKEKFEINKSAILSTLLIIFIVVGVVIPLVYHLSRFQIFFFLGVVGLTGLLTNWIAVKMLLDYVYLCPRSKKFPLPGSGILPKNLDKAIDNVTEFISDELLSETTIRKELENQISQIGNDVFNEFKSELTKEDTKKFLINSIIKNLLDNKEVHNLVNRRIEDIIKKQKNLVRFVLHKSGITPEQITNTVFDSIENALWDFANNETDFSSFNISLKDEKDRQWITNVLFNSFLKHFDVKSILKNSLQRFSTEDIKQILNKLGGYYFDWLILWGGILGIIAGIITVIFNCFL